MEDSLPTQRRLLTRVPGNTIGPLSLSIPPREWQARVRDISINGVGLETDVCLDRGTSLAIQPATAAKLSAELRAEVRHATMLSEGTWLLGCKFSRCLTIDDFAVLG